MFQEYRDRLLKQGKNNQEAVQNVSKRNAIANMMRSATKSEVLMGQKDEDMETFICIGSSVETYVQRRFLFLPETKIYKGNYIIENDMYYLITNLTFDDIYPQAFAEYCNETFKFVVGTEKIKTGVDKSGRPIYTTTEIIEEYPCTLTNKIYSEVENSAVPTPDGATIIRVPFFRDEKLVPKLNTVVMYHGNQFKVVNVNYDDVMKYSDGLEHGHLEIQLQREPVST